MWHKMREVTPFHTTGSVSLLLLAWAAFTITVRSLHFAFQMLFAGQSPRAIIPDCLQFTFSTSTPNVFHFVLASPFLHSWMTIRGMVPAEARLTSYLHVIRGGHSTSIPAVQQMQQWWKNMPRRGIPVNVCSGRPVICYYHFTCLLWWRLKTLVSTKKKSN